MSKYPPTAFPFVCQDHSKYQTAEPGMTLRDWFAGQIACNLFNGREFTISEAGFHPSVYDAVAREAYRFADAMMKASKGYTE